MTIPRTVHAGIGGAVPRKEDDRLVKGNGCFSDDFSLSGQSYAVMVRSPHAHARIGRINRAEALSMPDVLAVLTGADCLEDGLKSIPHRPIAESLQTARDAAELVTIDYEPLASVTGTSDAAKNDAPRVRDDRASNVCVDADIGDPAATELAFKGAAHVVCLETWEPGAAEA